MFKAILSFFKKIKSNKKRLKVKQYIPHHRGIWNYFRIFLLFCTLCITLSVSAAPINWEVTNLGNTQNRIAYGLVGDTAFQTQILASIQNNTFDSLINNNGAMLLGNYIVPTTGNVKSGNITVPNNKPYSMYVVVFDSTSSSLYTYADVTAIQTKDIKKAAVTFTFDFNTGSYTRIYNVPEPNVILLLIMATCSFLVSRP
jgi:hypothetical protein